MATTDLRPLSLGELLDRTFSYYRQHFWLFMGIMAFPQVLNVAVSLFWQLVPAAPAAPVAPDNPADVLKQFAPILVASIAFLLLFLIVSFLIYAVALGATTYALSEVHLGRTATVSSAYQSLRGKVGRLVGLVFTFLLIAFGVYLLMFALAMVVVVAFGALIRLAAPSVSTLLAVAVGVVAVLVFLVGAVAGAVFLLRYGVAVPALVLENINIGQALRRSAFLTRGYKGQILVIGVLMYMVTAVVAFVFQAPFFVASLLLGFKLGVMPLWLRVPYAASAGAGGALAGPFLMIALALAYYDTRVRKEGFDLQHMMASLDSGSTVQAPAAAVPPVAS